MDEKKMLTPNLDRAVQRFCESMTRNATRQAQQERQIVECESDPSVMEIMRIHKATGGVLLSEACFALRVGRLASAHSMDGDADYDACAAIYLAGKIAGVREERAKRRRKAATA